MTGENLETATQVELRDIGNNVFHTAAAAYADGKLTTEPINVAGPYPDEGSIRVATAGGSATYEVTFRN